MKRDYLYIVDGLFGIKTVGVGVIKEHFISGDFIEDKRLLMVLSPDFKDKAEVSVRKISQFINLDEGFDIKSFQNKYKQEIARVYKFKEEQNIHLSWLEIYQLGVLVSPEDEDSDIFSHLQTLTEFSKSIKANY